MKNIYDNGALMLGNVQDVIMEIEKELRDIDYEMVVCINYDNGMGYSIDHWSSNDIINKESEEK